MPNVPLRRRFVLLVNPRGGRQGGLDVLERVRPVFDAAGVNLDVYVSQYAGHAGELARTVELGDCDALCLIGGDGTVHEVVNGILSRTEPITIPVGFIPGGTGNTLHQEFHCEEPLAAARRIIAGRRLLIDAVRVTLSDRVVFCVNIIGWGAVTDINRTAERLRRFGRHRYTLAALSHVLRGGRRTAHLVCDEEPLAGDYFFVMACNTKHTGRGMKLAPRADIRDGKLDVVILRPCSRWQLLKLFARVFDGSHLGLPSVEYRQVRYLALSSPGHEQLNLDGELEGHAPYVAEVLPGALQILA